MKAIGLDTYGGPEVLHVVELPEAQAGAGQVRIRVRAAGVNAVDVMLREGRLAAAFPGAEPPFVPGMDVAGTIDQLGPDLDPDLGFTVGQVVVGIVDNVGSHGAYSELVALPAESVTAAPAGVGFAEAGSFLMNALAARNALDTLGLTPGSTMLVTGAAGAVGGYAVQLASRLGLTVIAVAAEADRTAVLGFGADVFVPRGDGWVERVLDAALAGVDGAIDAAVLGEQGLPAVRDGGRVVIMRGDVPVRTERGIEVLHVNVRQRARDHAAIVQLRELVDSGELALRVARRYPMNEAVEAHRVFDRGGLRGRIVLELP